MNGDDDGDRRSLSCRLFATKNRSDAELRGRVDKGQGREEWEWESEGSQAAAAVGLMVSRWSLVGTFSWPGQRQILDPRSGHRSRDIASSTHTHTHTHTHTQPSFPIATEAGSRDIPSAEINLTILDSFIACNWLQALCPDATDVEDDCYRPKSGEESKKQGYDRGP